MRARRGVLLLPLCLLLASCATVSGAGRSTADSRVDALLARMTLAEKVGQMTLISVSALRGTCQGGQIAPLNASCLQSELAGAHVGAVLSGGGESPPDNTPVAWAQMTNQIQRYALAHNRLHIPILYGVDAVHGHNNVLGATIFPHNIGLAATWDPALARQVAAATASDVRATGIHWVYAPVSDIARDLRWGRYYETFGEDPFLASQMVAATVRGFEGTNFSTGVSATAKHYVGYSGAQRGLDRTNATLPLRTLQQTYLPSFAAAVHASVGTVMADSGAVNGVPVHASSYLLTDILRRQLGFGGVVVTDWQDIESLYDRYHLATSYNDAIRLAINAGVDMSMVPDNGVDFAHRVMALVRAGKIPQSRIDDAVRRILTLKERLGLFAHPDVNAASANAAVLGAHRALARRAADESMVLLKNQGAVLPLHGVRTILVAGEAATNVAEQMGGWTIGWQGVPSGVSPPAVTVLQGIKAAAGSASVVDETDPARAAAAARHAGVAVVVLGERPGAEGPADTETAELPADQTAVAQAVEATGTPTVVVILAGRPLLIAPLIQKASAVLMAWLPGTEGGDAVADVLFGRVNPSGRLPVTWPRQIGQVPLTYDQLPNTSADPDAVYHPLFPFGAGLSYGVYTTNGLQAAAHGRSVTVSVSVGNAGSMAGDAVVPIYGRADAAPVLVPDKLLIGFARVHLNPNQTKSVTLHLSLQPLAVVTGDVNGSGPPRIVPGPYTIMAGTEQVNVTVH
ncbi:MAG TPA: glycoside hydrolase family 3 N-terminal domain-containing protein [Chloroflexota bacterium]|nr:glycoside hydrolase family 3 N-terminal domain-containing protein [Chloroflexota bacterium]